MQDFGGISAAIIFMHLNRIISVPVKYPGSIPVIATENTEIVTGIRRSDFSRELFMFATKVAPTSIGNPLCTLCLCGQDIIQK